MFMKLLKQILNLSKKEPDAIKLMKKIAKLLSDLSGYLHLAHTRSKHQANNKFHKTQAKSFLEIQERFKKGENVISDLTKMKDRLEKASSDWF